jgi:hypothetical protein
VKGKIIAAHEVKARWGYDEVTSARFGQSYKRNLPAPLPPSPVAFHREIRHMALPSRDQTFAYENCRDLDRKVGGR